jgi:WD40 repeat protein
VIEVANVFRGSGLNFLTPGPDVPLTPDTVLDVSHESLLRRWGRLQQWVEAEAKSADIYRRLAENAKAWKEGSREDYLDKLELAYSVEWKKREQPNAAWAQRYGGDYDLAVQFLQESEKAEHRRVAEEQAERKRKLKARYLSWGVVLALGGLAVAVFSLGRALHSANLAADSAQKAAYAAVKEEMYQKEIKDRERREADLEEALKLQRARTGFLRDIANQAENWSVMKPQRGVLLAVEAWHYASSRGTQSDDLTLTAEDTLRLTLSRIGGIGYSANQGPITRLAVNEDPKGSLRRLAAAGADGTIALWEVKEERKPPVLLRLAFGYKAPINQLMFAGGGRWLLADSGSAPTRSLTAWDLDTLNRPCAVLKWGEAPNIDLGKDWLLVYSAEKIQLFKLSETDLFARPVQLLCPNKPREFRYLSFSKKGPKDGAQWLAMISSDARAFVWDLKRARLGASLSGVELETDEADSSDPKKPRPVQARNGEFAEGGGSLVVCLDNGKLRSWKQAGGRWSKSATTVLREGAGVTLTTDRRGHLAVIAGKYPTPQNPSDTYLFDLSRPGTPSPITLKGFDSSIDLSRYVQVDDRKQWMAAVCQMPGQGLLLWNLYSPDAVKSPIHLRPREGVVEAKLSSDGRWIVTRGTENYVSLWNLGAPSFSSNPITLRGHDDLVSAFAVSEGGHWLITGGKDGTVRQWSLAFISPSIEPYVVHNSTEDPSVLVPAGDRWLVVAQPDGAVRFWDLSAEKYLGRSRREPCLGQAKFPSLTATDNGRWLVTYGDGDAALLWDLKTAKRPRRHGELDHGGIPIKDLYASPDGRWLASTADGTAERPTPYVRLWDLRPSPAARPGGKMTEFKASSRPKGTAWGFVASGKALLTESDLGYHLWGAERFDEILFIPAEEYEEKAFLTPEGDRLIIESGEDEAEVYDLRAAVARKKLKPQILKGFSFKNNYRVSSNGRWLFSLVSASGHLSYWDLGSDKENLMPTKEDSHFVGQVSLEALFSPDRRWLVTNGRDERAWLWDLNSADPQRSRTEIGTNVSWTRFTAFTADSSWLVVAANNTLRLYSLSASGAKAEFSIDFPSTPGPAPAVAVSRNRRCFAVSGQDSTRAWDLTKGQAVKPTVFPNGPGVLSFTPTDTFLSADGSHALSVDLKRNAVLLTRITLSELRDAAERTAGRNLSRPEWEQSQLGLLLGKWQQTFKRFDLPPPAEPPPVAGSGVTLGQAKQLQLGKAELDEQDVLTSKSPLDTVRKLPCKEYLRTLQAGKVYEINMRSTQLDSYLRLEDPEGREVARDDDGGGGLNARINYLCYKTGTYKIIATVFRSATGKYQVAAHELKTVPPPPVTELPFRGKLASVRGRLTADDLPDPLNRQACKVYSVRLQKGQVYQIDLRTAAFQAYLRLAGLEGVAPEIDSRGGGGQNARILFNCPQTGTYLITVSSANMTGGDFTLSAQSQ